MALRALMLRKKIDEAKKNLERAQATKAELEKREAELEASIAEAQTDEERATVEAAVAEYETDKAGNDAEVEKFETELRSLEEELTKEEAEKEQPAPVDEPAEAPAEERNKEIKKMKRTKFFGMTIEERDAFVAREDVKSFLERVRQIASEKRSVTGGDLLIPTVILELIRENISEYSKLSKHINLQNVPGTARQNVLGGIPEAVWTEACGKINELTVAFSGLQVDGYKVGGYIPVCNALLADSDVALAQEIFSALGAAIGFALDKAIVFGTGTKMPLGIFTRLAQTSDPSDPRVLGTWSDLHSSNIVTIANTYTGTALFQQILLKVGIASPKYARKGLVWIMNRKTHLALMAEALNFSAAGALVTGAAEMPVVGGAVEELEFMPDNVILAGYAELYLLAERAGASIKTSEEVKFLDDQTVFKGTARYDGAPVIAGAFVAIGIGGTTPSASGITFASDSANP